MGERLSIIGIFDGIIRAGNGWHIGTARELAACGFRPESFHGFGARTDKRDSHFCASTWQRRVFGKKTVAGMYRVAARAARDVNYFINAKIAFARGCGANGICFVGKTNVKRFAVNLTKNRRAANAQLAASAQNAHGDFAAIGNQNFLEHGPFVLPGDFSTEDIAPQPLQRPWCLIV